VSTGVVAEDYGLRANSRRSEGVRFLDSSKTPPASSQNRAYVSEQEVFDDSQAKNTTYANLKLSFVADELVGCNQQVHQGISDIHNQVQALTHAAQERTCAYADYVNYLDMRTSLLLSYCTILTFLTSLILSGNICEAHPAFQHAAELRMLLVRLQPVNRRVVNYLSNHKSLITSTDKAEQPTAEHRKEPKSTKNNKGYADSKEQEPLNSPVIGLQTVQPANKKASWRTGLHIRQVQDSKSNVQTKGKGKLDISSPTASPQHALYQETITKHHTSSKGKACQQEYHTDGFSLFKGSDLRDGGFYQYARAEAALRNDSPPDLQSEQQYSNLTCGEEQKRSIGDKIMLNRGLTASRNKIQKNPRKRNRLKHAKVLARRSGQVQHLRTKDKGNYQGEHTGIADGVSKSRRIRS